MRLISLMWISKRISGGLQFTLSIHWPWDRLLLGYLSQDSADEIKGISVFQGQLHLLILTLDITRVHLSEYPTDEEQ